MMGNKVSAWLRKWMLPLAMVTGISLYLILHYVPAFEEDGYIRVARWLQPTLVSVMLFLQLNVVAPSDLKLHRWHLWILLIQAVSFGALAFIATRIPHGDARILLECAMLCLICPTAAAAGVITRKIGGSLPGIMTAIVLTDLLASLMIPLMIPMVHPDAELHFWASFWQIVKRVFSILVLPCILAWVIRYLLPGVQRWLARAVDWAFYIWGFCLTMAMSLATYALVTSGIGVLVAAGIGAVSLACCLLQFVLGRKVARRYGRSECITSGQALGQKNTAFIIWLGFNYMTPVTSVAGGLYAIWQNLVNSWELAHTEEPLRHSRACPGNLPKE